MPNTWIDFATLRAQLSFAAVLDHYGVKLKIRGDRAIGFCPLPSHCGNRRTPSFSANLPRGIFQCFGGDCGAKGNVLDFACYMEGANPHDARDLRRVALKLQEQFGIEAGTRRHGGRLRGPSSHERPQRERPVEMPLTDVVSPLPHVEQRVAVPTIEANENPDLPRIVNAPLDFELRHLNPRHPYLKQRGLAPETVDHFGLGYTDSGLMKGRIAIPLHDEAGRLIGYAGRIVDEDKISADSPRYRLPGERVRDGVVHAFHKSAFLFNVHRIDRPVDELIVVEGFFSVFWLWQHGFINVVALMGGSCSIRQLELIQDLVREDGRVILFTDGNEAGLRCLQEMITAVSPHRALRWARLQDDRQPTDCDGRELVDLLGILPSAIKSGPSDKPVVATPAKKSNDKAGTPTTASTPFIPTPRR